MLPGLKSEPTRPAMAAAANGIEMSGEILKSMDFSQMCAWCGSGASFLACGRCKVRYCSKEHQRAAWKAGHKLECSKDGADRVVTLVGVLRFGTLAGEIVNNLPFGEPVGLAEIGQKQLGKAVLALSEITKKAPGAKTLSRLRGIEPAVALLAKMTDHSREPLPVLTAGLCRVLGHAAQHGVLEVASADAALKHMADFTSFMSMGSLCGQVAAECEVGVQSALKHTRRAHQRVLACRDEATCLECRQPADIACGGCLGGEMELDVRAWYCSESCAKAHWPQHKRECELHNHEVAPRIADVRVGFLDDPTTPEGAARMAERSEALMATMAVKAPERQTTTTFLPPLQIAAEVREWVLGGGDVSLCDEEGWGLVHLAVGVPRTCVGGKKKLPTAPDAELLSFLIDHKAPIDMQDHEGYETPIMRVAYWSPHLATVELLLAARCSLELRHKLFGTVLSMACERCHIRAYTVDTADAQQIVVNRLFNDPIVSALLAAGAEANTKSPMGGNPLMTAALMGSLATVRALLQAGTTDRHLALMCIDPALDAMSARSDAACEIGPAITCLLEHYQPLSDKESSKATLLGRCVVLTGLKDQPAYNGNHAIPIMYAPNKKRYTCFIHGESKLLMLKASSVTTLAEGDYGDFAQDSPGDDDDDAEHDEEDDYDEEDEYDDYDEEDECDDEEEGEYEDQNIEEDEGQEKEETRKRRATTTSTAGDCAVA